MSASITSIAAAPNATLQANETSTAASASILLGSSFNVQLTTLSASSMAYAVSAVAGQGLAADAACGPAATAACTSGVSGSPANCAITCTPTQPGLLNVTFRGWDGANGTRVVSLMVTVSLGPNVTAPPYTSLTGLRFAQQALPTPLPSGQLNGCSNVQASVDACAVVCATTPNCT